jgi:hypothetical protein
VIVIGMIAAVLWSVVLLFVMALCRAASVDPAAISAGGMRSRLAARAETGLGGDEVQERGPARQVAAV